MAQIGPTVRLNVSRSCFECMYCKSQRYHVQGDSGSDVSCTHPDIGNKYIGDTTYKTPIWCPVREDD